MNSRQYLNAIRAHFYAKQQHWINQAYALGYCDADNGAEPALNTDNEAWRIVGDSEIAGRREDV